MSRGRVATASFPQARDVGRDWILRLLGLLEDHYEALGKQFDLKDFDKDAWEMREARRKEHESGKKRRGSLSSIKVSDSA